MPNFNEFFLGVRDYPKVNNRSSNLTYYNKVKVLQQHYL